MKRYILLLILLLAVVGIAQAQSTPQPVQDAFADLNQRLGSNFTPNDFGWRWREQVFENRALGCSNQSSAGMATESIIGYVVELEVPNRGLWDYRISYNPPILFLCSPLPTATPRPLSTLAPTFPPPATFTPAPTFTPALCGVMLSRLTIGQEARVSPGIPNNLRAQPGASGAFLGEIPAEAVFIVLDGPRCSVDGAWWMVNYNGIIGWTLEGQGGDYYLEPMSLVVAPTNAPAIVATIPSATAIPVCNPEMPSRLQVGSLGRVTPGIPNNVRAQAGSSGDYLGEIPAEGVFTVLDGPRCASSVAWWQVNYNGLIGWTAEGIEGDYWLEPEFASFAAITLENLPNLQQLVNQTGIDGIKDISFFNDAQFALYVPTDSSLIQIAPSQTFAPSPNWVYTSVGVSDWGSLLAYSPSILVLADETKLAFYRFPDASAIFEMMNVGYQAILSPDGNSLVLSDTYNTIQILDVNTGETRVILPTADLGLVFGMQFSPDGRYLAANFRDGFVIWETNTWTSFASVFIGPPFEIKEMAITNESFAFALENGQNSAVFARPLSQIDTWQDGLLSYDGAINSLVIAPDNRFLLIATDSGIQMAEFPRGGTGLVSPLQLAVEVAIHSMRISEDGRFLAISSESTVSIWGISNP